MFKNTKLVGLLSLTACFFSAGIVAPVLSQAQEYPTQVATDWFVTFELQSCTRKQNSIVSCTFSLSPSQDGSYSVNSSNETKLVDSAGNEYYSSKIQSGTKVVGAGSQVNFNMVIGSRYKTTIDFNDVPTSVPYATLLQISTPHTGFSGAAKFRNVPFITLDGSIPEVPRSNRSPVNNQPANTNNSTPGRRLCLPIVGCLKGASKN